MGYDYFFHFTATLVQRWCVYLDDSDVEMVCSLNSLSVMSMLKIGLNTIYFTLISQKAQRTYICVLEGADVGAFCDHTWWRNLENSGKNHRNLG